MLPLSLREKEESLTISLNILVPRCKTQSGTKLMGGKETEVKKEKERCYVQDNVNSDATSSDLLLMNLMVVHL